MNNQRRKAIKALYSDIEALKPLLEAFENARKELEAAMDDVHSNIESIREEEQEYIDNLPENLQQSEKASNAEDAVSALDEAMEMADFNSADLETLDPDDIIGKLDEVAGGY